MMMNIQRQASSPSHSSSRDPPARCASSESTASDTKMPVTIASCCSEPSRPRMRGGEVSAM